MDYRTLFIFDVVSLACYAVAITAIAARYRKMIGLRWFAASVMLYLGDDCVAPRVRMRVFVQRKMCFA